MTAADSVATRDGRGVSQQRPGDHDDMLPPTPDAAAATAGATTDDAADGARHHGRQRRSLWSLGRSGATRRWLAAFGLAGFAVGLPLVRILGPHPEFFIAHHIGPAGVVAFGATVTVVLPAIVATIASVAGRYRLLLLTPLGVLASAAILQPVAGRSMFTVAAVGLGIAVAVSERHSATVRNSLAALGVVSVLAGTWFVGFSRTSDYVFAGDAEIVAVGAADDGLPPVVFLVFDEFPLTTLLNSSLDINRTRFPNFARLAAQSDWFRRAASVSPQTSYSVPAILSGRYVSSGAVPVASAYPASVFLQLGESHDAYAYEPVTALCPDELCSSSGEAVEGGSSDGDRAGGGVSELVRDSLVVYGHAVGTDQIRTDLPAINHSWSGFDGPDALLADVDDPATFASLGNEVMFPAQAAQLTALLDEPLASSDPHRSVGAGSRDEAAGGDASGDGRPPLYVAHVLAPHMPYVATPDGGTYPRREVTGMATVDARLAWPEGGPERHRIEAYQRLLLQVGAVDRLLGAVIDELEATGIWDDAIVVVTADHGASFEDGWFRSARAGGAEVTSVPLFIKAPHQAKGQVRDESALTIDAVPTLLGIAGVESPSTFDGLDLNHDQIPSTRDGAYLDDETRTPDQRLDALAAVVQRRTRWVEPDGGWGAVARAGSGGHFVGMPVGQLEVAAGTGGTWSTPVPTEGRTSRAVTVVRIAPPAVAVAPVTVLLACDGTVAGAGHNPQATGDAYEAFVFTDPDRCTNTSAMSLYVVQPDGTIRPMERVQ